MQPQRKLEPTQRPFLPTQVARKGRHMEPKVEANLSPPAQDVEVRGKDCTSCLHVFGAHYIHQYLPLKVFKGKENWEVFFVFFKEIRISLSFEKGNHWLTLALSVVGGGWQKMYSSSLHMEVPQQNSTYQQWFYKPAKEKEKATPWMLENILNDFSADGELIFLKNKNYCVDECYVTALLEICTVSGNKKNTFPKSLLKASWKNNLFFLFLSLSLGIDPPQRTCSPPAPQAASPVFSWASRCYFYLLKMLDREGPLSEHVLISSPCH